MNPHFPEIKKNFGFGLMRLPMIGEEVDTAQTSAMVDAFLEAGFNYFDTAHVYIQGKSEEAVKTCLADRHSRDSFLLANKLTSSCFEKEEEILPLLESQLKICGVEYFDFLLIHCILRKNYGKYTDCRAFEIAQELKAAGKVRHVGFSFHDNAEFLDKVLTEHPEVEFVQLQFNYADWEDPNVESRKCYETCLKHGKPVMVMEPVRGGTLINLPEEALNLMDHKPANFAIRYCAGFENVVMTLSGMSNMEQMEDNLSFMTDFRPLSEEEHAIIDRVRPLYQAQNRIPCTACRYCTDGCPAGIPIPELFAWVNQARNPKEETEGAYSDFTPNASACIGCGKCEKECPQHLHIRKILKEIHKSFS